MYCIAQQYLTRKSILQSSNILWRIKVSTLITIHSRRGMLTITFSHHCEVMELQNFGGKQ
jgi:hypothetical protein